MLNISLVLVKEFFLNSLKKIHRMNLCESIKRQIIGSNETEESKRLKADYRETNYSKRIFGFLLFDEKVIRVCLNKPNQNKSLIDNVNYQSGEMVQLLKRNVQKM